MASQREVKQDAVFQQAQEIFSGMEPQVIYIILSEYNFNLDRAMESLIMLSQGSEDTSTTQKTSPFAQNQPAKSNFQNLFDPETFNSRMLRPFYQQEAQNEEAQYGNVAHEQLNSGLHATGSPWCLTDFDAFSAYSTNNSETQGELVEKDVDFASVMQSALTPQNSDPQCFAQLHGTSTTPSLVRDLDSQDGTDSLAKTDAGGFDYTRNNAESSVDDSEDVEAPDIDVGFTSFDNLAMDALTEIGEALEWHQGETSLPESLKDKTGASIQSSPMKNTADGVAVPAGRHNDKSDVSTPASHDAAKHTTVSKVYKMPSPASVQISTPTSIERPNIKLITFAYSYTGVGALNGVRLTFTGKSQIPSEVLGIFPSIDPKRLFNRRRARKQSEKSNLQKSSPNTTCAAISSPSTKSQDSIQGRKSDSDSTKEQSNEVPPSHREAEGPSSQLCTESTEDVAESINKLELASTCKVLAEERENPSGKMRETVKDAHVDYSGTSGDAAGSSIDEESDVKAGNENPSSQTEVASTRPSNNAGVKPVYPQSGGRIGVVAEYASPHIGGLKPNAQHFIPKMHAPTAPPGFQQITQPFGPQFDHFGNPPTVRRMNDPYTVPPGHLPTMYPVQMQLHTPGEYMYPTNTPFVQNPYYLNHRPGYPDLRPHSVNPPPHQGFWGPMVSQNNQAPRATGPKSHQKSSQHNQTPGTSHDKHQHAQERTVKRQPMSSVVKSAPVVVPNAAPVRHEAYKLMYLLRGLPGSGKSTLARKLAGRRGRVLSTDDYFMTPSGEYAYNPMEIEDAHRYNQKRAKKCVQSGVSPIVIDNTNMAAWEMKPYAEMAIQHSYQVRIKEPSTPWKYKAGICARKNSHGVTVHTIRKMLERFEQDVTVNKLLTSAKPAASRPPTMPQIASGAGPCAAQQPLTGAVTLPPRSANNVQESSFEQAHAKALPPKQSSNASNMKTLPTTRGAVDVTAYLSPNSKSDPPLSSSTPVSDSRSPVGKPSGPTVHSPKGNPIESQTNTTKLGVSREYTELDSTEVVPAPASSSIPVAAHGDTMVSRTPSQASTPDSKTHSGTGTSGTPRPRSINSPLAIGTSLSHKDVQKLSAQERRSKSLSPSRSGQTRMLHELRFPFKKTSLAPTDKKSIEHNATEMSSNQQKELDVSEKQIESRECQNDRSAGKEITVVHDIPKRNEEKQVRQQEKSVVDLDCMRPAEAPSIDSSLVLKSTLSEKERSGVDRFSARKQRPGRSKLAAVFAGKPLLSDELKQKFSNESEWSNTDNVENFSEIDSKINQACQMMRKSSGQKMADSSTAMDAADFVIARKAEFGHDESFPGFTLLTGDAVRFVPGKKPTHEPARQIAIKTFDKSVSVGRSPEKGKQSDRISHDLDTLKLLFDDLPADKLHEIYQDCDQNLEWTSNILAESSMFGEVSFSSKSFGSMSGKDQQAVGGGLKPAEVEISNLESPATYSQGVEEATASSVEGSFAAEHGATELSEDAASSATTESFSQPSSSQGHESSFPVASTDEDSSSHSSRLQDDKVQTLSLSLPKEFVHSLAKIFGGLPDEKGRTTSSANVKGPEYGKCSVEIGMVLAEKIHDVWVKTATRKRNMQLAMAEFRKNQAQQDDRMRTWELEEVQRLHRQYEEDEQLARRLQQAEDRGESEYQKPPLDRTENNRKMKKKPTHKRNNYKNEPPVKLSPATSSTSLTALQGASLAAWTAASSPANSESKSMLEIMSEEAAAEESERKQREERINEDDFSSRMKRKELHEMYPGLPDDLLDDIFSANNKNLESTVFAVNCFWWDEMLPTESVMSERAREVYDTQMLEIMKLRSSSELTEPIISRTTQATVAAAAEVRDVTSINTQSYESLRAEASLHHEQMEEAFKKAAAAFQQKKRGISTYYAHQGHLHRVKFKEANRRAAEMIYQQRNVGRRDKNEIDLHGLHVNEALATLSQKLSEIKDSGTKFIKVITGKGTNSYGGVPKIKNAVTEWLSANHFKYSELEGNPGMLRIEF